MNDGALAAALARLAPQLQAQATGIAGLQRLSGGASQETWSFDLAGPRPAVPLILRRMPRADRRGAYAAGPELEAAVIECARRAGVPVPPVRRVLQPGDAAGRGFIMDRIEGETRPARILRDDCFQAARACFAEQAAAILARIHAMDHAGLRIARQVTPQSAIEELHGILRGVSAHRPVFEVALAWLRHHAPAPVAEPCVVHGDFRNGNLIFGPQGVRAVLDWELVHLGDPLEDLGWLRVGSWRFGNLDKPFGGIAADQAFLSAYHAASGRHANPARLRFWEMLGTLRWGTLCAAMVEWVRSGEDRSIERMVIARRASETEIDLLNLLQQEH